MSSILRHPLDNTEYELREDGNVLVRDPESGREGVFALGGAWVSGELRHADAHLIRWAYDMGAQHNDAYYQALREQQEG